MPSWDASLYLQFALERTRPARELASRVAVAHVRTAIDLGCGPGNSTGVLAERWPAAALVGIDNAAEMIAAARREHPGGTWRQADITDWAAGDEGPFDLVFSNAALQWVSDHGQLLPRLLRKVSLGGALAVQMPSNSDAPAHRLARALAASDAWRDRFHAGGVRQWHVHEPAFYYDALAPLAAQVDLWETEYTMVMPDAETILQWYRGTGLRPYFDALSSADAERFSSDYLRELRLAYPPRPFGPVLFPFRRLFVIAYRGESKGQ